MLNVAIAGFGQIGSRLYELIQNSTNVQCVCVFSARKLDLALPVYKYDMLDNVKESVDVVALTTSSFSQTPKYAKEFASVFNTIDCFDNTDVFEEYKNELNSVCKATKHTSVVGCGWDPGLFDMVRKMFTIFPEAETKSLWGRGMSCGHTNALKNVYGVTDAVEITQPQRNGHLRECYVVASGDKKRICEDINSIEHYFANLHTKIRFVNAKKLDSIKQNKSHKGSVSFSNGESSGRFSLEMKDNPLFTAQIMFAYLPVVLQLAKKRRFSALELSEIPLSLLTQST